MKDILTIKKAELARITQEEETTAKKLEVKLLTIFPKLLDNFFLEVKPEKFIGFIAGKNQVVLILQKQELNKMLEIVIDDFPPQMLKTVFKNVLANLSDKIFIDDYNSWNSDKDIITIGLYSKGSF